MITKELLDDRHEQKVAYAKTKNSNYGSPPQKMSVDGRFNIGNWNGGDAIIRQFTYWLERTEYSTYAKEFDYKNFSCELISSLVYFEDRKFVNITVKKFDSDLEHYGDHRWSYDFYFIEYYKDRGRTDKMFYNSELINYDDCIELLNTIEASGFKFEL